jgi:UDP-N-acetylglucosamine transferase subunit ALG13
VFRVNASEADLLIAHAGIGFILTAMELQKLIVLFPRKASLGEHRNENQFPNVKNRQELSCFSQQSTAWLESRLSYR